jgi:hypothetical protein
MPPSACASSVSVSGTCSTGNGDQNIWYYFGSDLRHAS